MKEPKSLTPEASAIQSNLSGESCECPFCPINIDGDRTTQTTAEGALLSWFALSCDDYGDERILKMKLVSVPQMQLWGAAHAWVLLKSYKHIFRVELWPKKGDGSKIHLMCTVLHANHPESDPGLGRGVWSGTFSPYTLRRFREWSETYADNNPDYKFLGQPSFSSYMPPELKFDGTNNCQTYAERLVQAFSEKGQTTPMSRALNMLPTVFVLTLLYLLWLLVLFGIMRCCLVVRRWTMACIGKEDKEVEQVQQVQLCASENGWRFVGFLASLFVFIFNLAGSWFAYVVVGPQIACTFEAGALCMCAFLWCSGVDANPITPYNKLFSGISSTAGIDTRSIRVDMMKHMARIAAFYAYVTPLIFLASDLPFWRHYWQAFWFGAIVLGLYVIVLLVHLGVLPVCFFAD